MKKKDLIIALAGQTASGKSRLTYLLKKFLRENGFEVEQELNFDYLTEEKFDKVMSENFDDVISKFKDTRKITLREVQLGIINNKDYLDIKNLNNELYEDDYRKLKFRLSMGLDFDEYIKELIHYDLNNTKNSDSITIDFYNKIGKQIRCSHDPYNKKHIDRVKEIEKKYHSGRKFEDDDIYFTCMTMETEDESVDFQVIMVHIDEFFSIYEIDYENYHKQRDTSLPMIKRKIK